MSKERKKIKDNNKKFNIKNFANYLNLIFMALVIIAIIFLIIFSFINKNKETKNKTEISDSLKFKKEYENLNSKKSSNGKEYPEVLINDDNIVKYTTYKEINKILDNKENALIYFGFESCPWCRNAVPILIQAASSTGLNKIYYLNIKNDRNELKKENNEIITVKKGKKEYNLLVERLKDKLDTYSGLNDENIKRIYAPTVMFIKNGEVINIHTSTVDSQSDPYIILNKEQRKELYDIYKNNILEILNSTCDEAC